MKICAATGNAGKLRELRRILEAQGHEVVSQKQLPPRVLPSRRDGLPFFTAMVEARSLFRIPRQPLLPKFGQSAGNVRT